MMAPFLCHNSQAHFGRTLGRIINFLAEVGMENVRHSILAGKVQLFKRPRSQYWQADTYVGGQRFKVSTKEDSLSRAKSFAEDWYMGLRGQSHAGILKPREITFEKVAKQFLLEYEAITEGQRSEKWVQGYDIRLRLHLIPFFGNLGINQVTAGKVQEYRVLRSSQAGRQPKNGLANGKPKPPSRSTIHDEIVALRQVLKTAVRHGWLQSLPDLSAPYKTQGKIVHRPWFSPNEYKHLYKTSREYAKNKEGRYRWNAEQLHDFILFMGNTGLRPDEVNNVQFRDVSIVKNVETGERILEIEVRGKRGVGYCKSMPGAVPVFERLKSRPKPGPHIRLRKGQEAPPPILPKSTDVLFPTNNLKMFNEVLDLAELKYDRDGQARTAYSLRHTYICLRLMEGADIYQIAKNCRTSVEMIEKFYAAHIKNTLDATAINVRRSQKHGFQPENPSDHFNGHYEDEG